MRSNEALAQLLSALRALPGARRLRIHTRAPVTLPMRIDAGLLECLSHPQPLYLVCHFNHPKELSPQAHKAILDLQSAGVILLNQSVLLKGVNAELEILMRLFSQLLDWGILPYALHHPDRVQGTGHLRLSLEEGLKLWRGLRGRLSGLGIPEYLLEIPGGGGKVPVDSGAVQALKPGLWRLKSPLGDWSFYREELKSESGTSEGNFR